MGSLLESPAAQCRHQLRVAQRAMNDLHDAHLTLVPAPNLKTAGWLIGHLAITGDFGRRILGSTNAICPKDWRQRFSPGSQPSTRREDYPSMDELRSAFRGVYASLAEAAAAADDAIVAGENPYEATRSTFPRAGDFAGYLLAGHFAYHLGQLSAWRAAAGLPVLGPAE